MTTKEEWMMAATEARGERDEALAECERYRKALTSIMQECGNPTERQPARYHENVTACYYIARDAVMYHEDRLPAAGGAE